MVTISKGTFYFLLLRPEKSKISFLIGLILKEIEASRPDDVRSCWSGTSTTAQ
jgi:hypothetical protein